MVEVDGEDGCVLALGAEQVDHRLANSGGVHVEAGRVAGPFAGVRGDFAESIGHRAHFFDRQSNAGGPLRVGTPTR